MPWSATNPLTGLVEVTQCQEPPSSPMPRTADSTVKHDPLSHYPHKSSGDFEGDRGKMEKAEGFLAQLSAIGPNKGP